MEPHTERPPASSEEGFVDRVRADLDQADADGDAARLETLERIRGHLEAELDSSLENGATGH